MIFPEPIAAAECICVSAEPDALRQCAQEFRIAAADYNIVDFQGGLQARHDAGDVAAPNRFSAASPTRSSYVRPFLYGRCASSIGSSTPSTISADPSPVPRPRKSMRLPL